MEYENQIYVIKLGDYCDIEVPFHQPVLNLNRLKVKSKLEKPFYQSFRISRQERRLKMMSLRMTYLAEEKVIDKVYIQQPSEVVCCEFIYRLFGGICNKILKNVSECSSN